MVSSSSITRVLPFTLLAFFLTLTSLASPGLSAPARHNWGGADSFFLYALSQADRVAHLAAMHDAGMKVVRIFISAVGKGAKGSSAETVPDVEPRMVGEWDDSVLEKIDQLMVEAVKYGVKLDMSVPLVTSHTITTTRGAC